MSTSWKPTRTLAECHALMTARGQIHETEYKIINGQVQKVYKTLWPTLREFFLDAVSQHASKELVIFEDIRLSYRQCLDQALKVAGVLRDKYGIVKGDRVAIVSRNYPEYITTFWGIQLLGAVSVLVNAWLPEIPLYHSISHANTKVLFVDSERAPILDVQRLRREVGTKGFIIFRPYEGKGRFDKEWLDFEKAIQGSAGNVKSVLETNPGIVPEDNATIFFTSGTTGLPKGVLSTQRNFLSNFPNAVAGRLRALLRRGEAIPQPNPSDPQKGIMISVPLFHVTGLTVLSILAMAYGYKIVLMRKWEPEAGAHIIRTENIAAAGGVPSMVSDIADSSAVGAPSIETFMFGGAPAHAGLAPLAAKKFPKAMLSQAYGMTETNGVAVSNTGEDYIYRPQSTGLACPANELIVVKDNQVAKPFEAGEVWMKGPNVMKCYWNEPEATKKVLTSDGWLKSGDLGYLDEEGFLFIKDRAKDIIIRGGENIDSVSVENALHADERVMEVAAIGVPGGKLGELPAAVVTLKKGFFSKISERELIDFAAERLPRFAVPVMVIIRQELLERNPAGKITKGPIRKYAAEIWAQRNRGEKAKL